jgi:CRISPR-associated protein Csy1
MLDLDPAIEAFFQERKAARIKAKIKATMSDEEQRAVEQQVTEDFALEAWLPNAAKRAKQLFLVSHPSKFSHPSAKTSAIIATCARNSDGFVRTGNVVASTLDVFGNAAALDVYKFLSLVMENGKTVLENLEEKTETIQQQFTLTNTSFEELHTGFLAIKNKVSTDQTSEKVKQVYFPVDDDYHLLSILTPSGLMFKLKERISAIRFSEQTKQARKAKREETFDEQGFAELYDLSVIGFGGTKPQNISILNSQNYGQAYLLQSLPPSLQKRTLQLPKKNFFVNTLNPWLYKESFQSYHNLIVIEYNNVDIRQGSNKVMQFIFTEVIAQMWRIRQLEQDWSTAEAYNALPTHQKIWLDNRYINEREANDDWLVEIKKELARWFLVSYKKVIGAKAKTIGAEHLPDIKAIIEQNREGLR